MDTVAEIGHYLGHLTSFFIFRKFLTLNISVTCKDVSQKEVEDVRESFSLRPLLLRGRHVIQDF